MMAFLGGTGPEGRGLALRFALAEEEVIIGSRDAGRAKEAASVLKELAPGSAVSANTNMAAAQQADIVFVTVPYDAQASLLNQLANQLARKVVVEVVAPLTFTGGRARAVDVPEGSAALQAKRLLPASYVVAAFQNLSAQELIAPEVVMEGDVVVCSDHTEPKAQVMELVSKIRDLRPVDGNGLENSRYVEELTPLLLNINRIYKAHSTIKIMGI